MNLRTAIFCALIAYGFQSTAEAQNLSQAIELEDQGRLAAALQAFEEALDFRGNSRADLSLIYEHLGVLRFAAGDPEGAHEAFQRLLAVEPVASAPDAAPPELEEIFFQAANQWEGHTLRAELDSASRTGSAVILTINIIDDLNAMVSRIVFISGATQLSQDHSESSTHEIVLPNSSFEGEQEMTLQLLNAQDGVLWEQSMELPTLNEEPTDPEPTSGSTMSAGRIGGITLIASGLTALIVGAVLVGVDGNPTGLQEVRQDYYWREIYDTNIGGWLLIGLGISSSIGGLIWLLLSRRGRSNESRQRGLLPHGTVVW